MRIFNMILGSRTVHRRLYSCLNNSPRAHLFVNDHVSRAGLPRPPERAVAVWRTVPQGPVLARPAPLSAVGRRPRGLSGRDWKSSEPACQRGEDAAGDSERGRRPSARVGGGDVRTSGWVPTAPLTSASCWQRVFSISRPLLCSRLGARSTQPLLLRAPPARVQGTHCTDEEKAEHGRRACQRRPLSAQRSRSPPHQSPPHSPPKMQPCADTPLNPCADDPRRLMDPRCKTAMVMGGAGGIGCEAARQLLEEGAERVVLCDTRATEAHSAVRSLNKRFGKGRAVFVPADVTNGSDLECVFRIVAGRFRPPQILLNCAGHFDENCWYHALDVNLKGVVRCCNLALRHMGVDGGGEGGVVVNASAAAAWEVLPTAPVFCAAKRAVLAVTECYGHERVARRTKVRVVSLCPTATRTGHVSTCRTRYARPEWARETRRRVARWGGAQSARAVGHAVAFLVRCGRTGQHYVVEGGCVSAVQQPPRSTCARHVATFL